MERIEITLKNGDKFTWYKAEFTEEFTEYSYDGKCVIIKKDERWIGVFPIDSLLSFVYFEK